MQGPIGFTIVVTIPPGAQPGQRRIVIDGTRGAIFEYNTPGNTLVGSWAASAGTDPFGNAYPQGFSIGPGSVFSGINFILNAQGLFFYNGTPALGNLIMSITPQSGTDSFGNIYQQGFAAYFGSSSTLQMFGNQYAAFDRIFPPVHKAGMNWGGASAADQSIILTSGNVSSETPVNISIRSSTEQVVINTGIAAGSPLTHALLELIGYLAMQDIGAAPATVAGATILYTMSGALHSAFIHADTSIASDVSLYLKQQGSAPGAIAGYKLIYADGVSVILPALNIPVNAGSHFGVDGNGLIYLISAAPGGNIRALAQITGDTNNRWQMDDSGVMQWGSGASGVDTSLKRSGTNTLETAGALLSNRATAGQALEAKLTTDTFARFEVDESGKIQWGPGGATPVDAALSRTSAGTNTFSGSLVVGNALEVLSVILAQDSVLILGNITGIHAGYATIGASAGDHLRVGNDVDNNQYMAESLYVSGQPAQLISAVGAVAITGAVVNVAAQRYIVKAHVAYTTSAAAGNPNINLFGSPGVTTPFSTSQWAEGGTVGNALSRQNNTFGGLGGGIPLASGNGGVVDLWSEATFTGSGTVTLQASTTIAGDNFTISYFNIQLIPLG